MNIVSRGKCLGRRTPRAPTRRNTVEAPPSHSGGGNQARGWRGGQVPDNRCHAHAPSLLLGSSCDSELHAGPQARAPPPHRHPRGHLSLRRGARVLPLEAASLLPGRQSRCRGTTKAIPASQCNLSRTAFLFCVPSPQMCWGLQFLWCPVGILELEESRYFAYILRLRSVISRHCGNCSPNIRRALCCLLLT